MNYLQQNPRRLDTIGRIFQRKLLMLGILIMVIAAGMAATFWITPKYEATMTILVSKERVDPQITSSEQGVDITQSPISDEEFNSELELLKSLEVVSGAVNDLDLVHDRSPRLDGWLDEKRQELKEKISGSAVKKDEGDGTVGEFSLQHAVNHVVANLDVTPTKKSRVIKVTYVDTDPIRAKRTLEAIYNRYVQLHVQLSEKSEATDIFNAQSGKYDEKLSTATNTLRDFDAANGISGADLSTQQGLLLKQLSDAQTLSNTTRTELAETEKKIVSLREKIAAEPQQIQTGYVSKYVQALDKMKEELTSLEQQRTQLLQKYQPTSRFVRENQERIDQIRRNIAEETANPPQERSFAINDLRRKLEAELYDAQTALASLKERDKGLTAQVTKLSGEVAQLNARSIERTQLERQKNINEEAYLLYQKKARENEIGRVLNKEKVLNFALVDAPRTDGERKFPKPMLNLVILFGIGLMTAVTVALILERLTHQPAEDLIHSAGQLRSRYEVPVLASIPNLELAVAADSSPRVFRKALLPAPKPDLPYLELD